MAKITEDLINKLEDDEYDIFEDIQDEDFVFVVAGDGKLKGISLPTNLNDNDEINPAVAELINYLVTRMTDDTRPTNASLH